MSFAPVSTFLASVFPNFVEITMPFRSIANAQVSISQPDSSIDYTALDNTQVYGH